MKKGKEESTIIGDEPCPSCRSMGRDKTGNHLIVFSNGNKHCNRCGYKEVANKLTNREVFVERLTDEQIESLRTLDYRGVDKDIWESLGVKMATSEEDNTRITAVYYPVYNTEGECVGWKKRTTAAKKFSTIGEFKGVPKMLFGQRQVGEGGKMLIIVEGEDDTGAAKQMLKNHNKTYNVVGLPFGSNNGADVVRRNISFIESFSLIVLALDMDKPGQDAAQEIAGLISPGKVKIAAFSEKDACDLLKHGKDKEFLDSIWKAKTFQVKGIVNPMDVMETWIATPPRVSYSLPACFSQLESSTKGVGEGEVWLWTGGTGGGKSQIQDENIVHWVKQGIRVGFIKMEHSQNINIQALLSTYMGVNLKVDELRQSISDDELRKYYTELYGGNNIFMIDHGYEESSDSSLIDRIRQLIVGFGCKIIVLDHIHAVLYEDGEEGDENRRTDKLLRTLAKMAAQYSVNFQVVAHPRKTGSGNKSAESGAFITLDDLKGSSGLKQIPDMVIAAVRDVNNEDPVIRRQAILHLLKNRWMGETGQQDQIIFNRDSCTYSKPIDSSQY